METAVGNLVALAFHGEYKVDKSSSLSIIPNLHTNTLNLLERNSDIFWINAIRIQNKYDITSLNKIGIIFANDHPDPGDEKTYVMTVQFDLIRKLSLIEYDEQYITIYIPVSLFFTSVLRTDVTYGSQIIPSVAIDKYTTNINITSDYDMCYDIIGKYTYLDREPRMKLAQEQHVYISNIITSMKINSACSPDNLQTIKMPSYGVMTGFFIETEQLPTQLELIFNMRTYWKYDKYMIKHISQKICSSDNFKYKKYLDNFIKTSNLDIYTIKEIESFIPLSHKCLYWIPLEYRKKWDNPIFGSTIDLSKSDKTELILNSSFNGTIHFMLQHVMHIYHGKVFFTPYTVIQ